MKDNRNENADDLYELEPTMDFVFKRIYERSEINNTSYECNE